MNTPYTKNNPLYCSIKQKTLLSKNKDTRHVVLDFDTSTLDYVVGDSIAILPKNPAKLVENILKHFALDPTALVTIRGKEESLALSEALSSHLNLNLSKKFITFAAALSENNPYLSLLQDKDTLKATLANSLLHELPKLARVVSAQEFVDNFRPLLPRFYSIASSQPVVGNEVHLTITNVKYEINGKERVGICTNYLLDEAPINTPSIPIYLQKANHFYLPSDPSTNIIMVSAGTGIAPFRAFLQERFATNAPGKNWLFFGERNRESDFYYQEEWDLYLQKEFLELDLAFSRDQEEKVYVQHKLDQKGQQVWEWIKNGAYFYLCGDAQTIGKDVESTLLKIIKEYGNFDDKEAKDYLKTLKREKRYLKDVY